MLVICGPTASGKSIVADGVADLLSYHYKSHVPVLAVDSMQVYREIPIITNQERRRPAELVGFTSVAEEWTMARHRLASYEIVKGADTPVVFDAGTGMYLNAILLDIPIAPRVPEEVRRMAGALSAGANNPRRVARAKELELSGADRRRSIWDGDLRYHVRLLYLRPTRDQLDSAIEKRSSKITRQGVDEAAYLAELFPEGVPNPSVRDSIGVKELIKYTTGQIPLEEALEHIETRTRRLARRQMRWFDKLVRTLQGRARTIIREEQLKEAKVEETVSRFLDAGASP